METTEEKDLLAEYGSLQLEKETHIARLQDTERRMQQIKQKLIALKQNGERDSS